MQLDSTPVACPRCAGELSHEWEEQLAEAFGCWTCMTSDELFRLRVAIVSTPLEIQERLGLTGLMDSWPRCFTRSA